jgi:hypothetical protein
MTFDRLYELARSDKSVTSELAKNPKESPGEIAHTLYSHLRHEGIGDKSQLLSKQSGLIADLQTVLECGKWGDQHPSDLFLKVGNTNICVF